MDRSTLQQSLAEIEQRIAQGEQQIAAQRKVITELKRKADVREASHAKYLRAP